MIAEALRNVNEAIAGITRDDHRGLWGHLTAARTQLEAASRLCSRQSGKMGVSHQPGGTS